MEHEAGFRQFATGHWPALVRTAYLITADRTSAQACAEQALAATRRHWSGAGEAAAARADACVVAAALSWRHRRPAPVPGLNHEPDPEADTERAAERAGLLDAWTTLSRPARAAVTLLHLQHLPPGQVAGLLRRSPAQVQDQADDGAAQLRRLLGLAEPGSPGPFDFDVDLSAPQLADPERRQLPEWVASGLTSLAAAATAGLEPWPGLSLAIRRSRRQRLAAAGSAALVIAGVAAVPQFLPAAERRPISTARAVVAGPATLTEAGYAGPIGGSLGDDARWLDGVRAQTAATSMVTPEPEFAHPGRVRVLFTGDLGGRRWAITLRQHSGGTWETGVLGGPVGARAGLLDPLLISDAGDVLPEPVGAFITTDRKTATTGVAWVMAPLATRVEVATSAGFTMAGDTRIIWRSLEKQGGMVWIDVVSESEWSLATYRITGPEGPGRPISGIQVETGTRG